MSATIGQTIDELREALTEYIEATYHISHPDLVEQRRSLLNAASGIYQLPYIESTPRYVGSQSYAEIDDLPAAALDAFRLLASPETPSAPIFPKPYLHQHQALRETLTNDRNLMVMTGTGSGKTESFLLPILGKLAIEASKSNSSFAQKNAVRALILYPMNALVNDQLGRLRTLFGHPATIKLFEQWSGRPALFARYTSRTPYAGLRNPRRDGNQLASIGTFFGELEDAASQFAQGDKSEEAAKAYELFCELKERGKWPAKESVSEWLGKAPKPWKDRANRMAHDAELLTRHEVQQFPPDLLITNYSMLEYMMMRPIERPIFDATREWLEQNPEEKFLIVLDEAHLYRGAQGAEVGLLVRRLRDRLGIPPERMQVICATASFSDAGKANAGLFGAQLTGSNPDSFVPITGELLKRSPSAQGQIADAEALSSIDLKGFYSANIDKQKSAIAEFLSFRDVGYDNNLEAALYHALSDYPVLNLLVNETMDAAVSLGELPSLLFSDSVDGALAESAVTSLLAVASRARAKAGDASLLPCRIHSFFRGLPGLWICMNDQCPEVQGNENSPGGKLFSQPRPRCDCGAPVLEYFTCRHCGTSYARAYSDNIYQPHYLWAEEGERLSTAGGPIDRLQPLDLLLEEPRDESVAMAANYDLVSGQINPENISDQSRTVFLKVLQQSQDDEDGASQPVAPGQFSPCGCCGQNAGYGRSSVQDHQTKGDQPFQALLSAQLRIQPPSPQPLTSFAPLRGRKVLIFSDSRQVAAKLAGTLKDYSLKDAVRVLLPLGYQLLSQDTDVFDEAPDLDKSYLAVLIAAHKLGVRLRPELESGESLYVIGGESPGPVPTGLTLSKLQNKLPSCPARLQEAIWEALKHRNLGLDLEALAIGSIVESDEHRDKIYALPIIPGLAEADAEKSSLVRAWLRCWSHGPGIWFKDMPKEWLGDVIKSHKGKFKPMDRVLKTPPQKKAFEKDWLPQLLQMFTQQIDGVRFILANNLALELGGVWRRCATCKSVHRPVGSLATCVDCGSSQVSDFDPDEDQVFEARKGFYRDPIASALKSDSPDVITIVAAEHTAQIGNAQPEDAFSHAEKHEIRFQDIDVAWRATDINEPAIDVLSSTTTMEVGIDIGALSGVALRNMPPTRANYQQRAGRAGRRANAVATVVAFGSVDSHDDHYFTQPAEMIKGAVIDPRLTLENPEITKRHLRAFLLQRYHQARIPGVSSGVDSNLFSVLGKIGDFKSLGSTLNRTDLETWLNQNALELREAADNWLPSELASNVRTQLLDEMMKDTLEAIDDAIGPIDDEHKELGEEGELDDKDEPEEILDNDTVDPAKDKLLDRLLYKGVIPRYAFPTDVVAFHVFNKAKSSAYRNVVEYSPTQGLSMALSQYAPNKQLWINNQQYTSKAIYSPYKKDRTTAWQKRRLYFECTVCGHADTDEYSKERENATDDCPACGNAAAFGPAKVWFRPVGFAHPIDMPGETRPDGVNETARATRAKLTMKTPKPDNDWTLIGERVRAYPARDHLLVSNAGLEKDGYDYCTDCGRIEPTAQPEELLWQPHERPYRSDEDGPCQGNFTRRNVVLGTDFKTDIALFSFPLTDGFRMLPGSNEAEATLRTVCEALSKAAAQVLDIESGEVLAEFRPSVNELGESDREVEIFLYDTLPGGAGFSTSLITRADELFDTALSILEACPAGCDSSCYRCLRSFRNRIEHSLLDRKLGVQFLEHALKGGYASYPQDRIEASIALLAKDFERQFGDEFQVSTFVERGDPDAGMVEIPFIAVSNTSGTEYWADLSSPLAPDQPASKKLRSMSPSNLDRLRLANDLIVRKNIAQASLNLRDDLL